MNVEEARRILRSAKRIVSFSGAGLSAESGVPTFRNAREGLWAKFDPMMLASPQGFEQDPKLVIEWYNWRRTQLAALAPNPAHRALAARCDITHITQNVDDLLERAGVAGESLVHLHGELAVDRCHESCGFSERVDLTAPPARRACPSCGAAVRPGVVWFGEMLPQSAWERALDAVSGCDALFVIGTSASVYPAAGLIDVARHAGAAIIVVNTERSDRLEPSDLEIVAAAGKAAPAILEVA